jgi:hypothetical protein
LDQLRDFYSWWKKNDWRGQKGQRPTTHQVKSLWATAMSESKGGLNGSSTERQLLGKREEANGGFKPTRIPGAKLS